MPSTNQEIELPPTTDEIASLKRLTAGIIRTQGNRFVKELLRDKGIRIGTNKDDFIENLNKAIEGGQLKLNDVSEWLDGVEGWGNQHVYPYRLVPALCNQLTVANVHRNVKKAGLQEVWNAETVLEFPEAPKLTSISFKDTTLRLLWQESSPDWTPVQDKNYTTEEGLDTFEYRAYRRIEHRAVTRFEAHLDTKLAGLFIAKPIQGAEHKTAITEAKKILASILDLSLLERGLFNISVVSRNLDQQNVPTNTNKDPEVKTQKSRLASGGSYIEFAATSSGRAYWEESAIMDVRKSVRSQQLAAFQGTDGVFVFQARPSSNALNRALRVQLYGNDNRVRLWAQMSVEEVWSVIKMLNAYQKSK